MQTKYPQAQTNSSRPKEKEGKSSASQTNAQQKKRSAVLEVRKHPLSSLLSPPTHSHLSLHTRRAPLAHSEGVPLILNQTSSIRYKHRHTQIAFQLSLLVKRERASASRYTHANQLQKGSVCLLPLVQVSAISGGLDGDGLRGSDLLVCCRGGGCSSGGGCLGLGLAVEELVLEEVGVAEGSGSGTEVWAEPENPMVVPVSRDGRHTKSTGRVDGAVVDWDGNKVSDSHSEANHEWGHGRDVLVGLGAHTVCSSHDGHDEHKGTAELDTKGLLSIGACRDLVGTTVHFIKESRGHDADKASTAHGAEALGSRVGDAAERGDLLGEHQCPRDGRVDVATRNTSKDKDENSDGAAEHKRNLKLAGGCDTTVLGEDDATNGSKEEHKGGNPLSHHRLAEGDARELLHEGRHLVLVVSGSTR